MIHWSSANGRVREAYNRVIDKKTNFVAIKQLNYMSKQEGSEFRTEIEMLSKFLTFSYSASNRLMLHFQRDDCS
ncbi:hypothetical protein LguiA_030849 [Lonicera macranthoides]